MRIRTVKPEFFRDGVVTKLPPLERLLFIGLWCCADRFGRLEDRPDDLHLAILPGEHGIDIYAMLEDLRTYGLIRKYEVDGRSFICVVNFEKHQQIRGREAQSESKFPAPPKDLPGKTLAPSEDLPRNHGKERKGKERKGITTLAPSSATTKPTSPVEMIFFCNGTPNYWELTTDQVAEWSALYPGIDVLAEARHAGAWIGANRKKTAGGMRRFLVGWLNRTNDRMRADIKAVAVNGAYREPPGARKTTKASSAYTEAYLRAKAEGKTIEEATEIAKAAR